MKRILFIVIALFIVACGGPSEKTGARALKVTMEGHTCPGCVEIERFEKVNGIRDGIHYSLEFEARVNILRECTAGMDSFPLVEPHYSFSTKKRYHPGDSGHIRGTILFVKSEKGWLHQDSDLSYLYLDE